jgi:hypothetical protein
MLRKRSYCCLPTDEYVVKIIAAEQAARGKRKLTVEVLEGQYDGHRTKLVVPFDSAIMVPGMCFMAKILRCAAGSLKNTLTQLDLLGYEWTAT